MKMDGSKITLTQVASSLNPPGTVVYTGTITGGTANAFAGTVALISGFPETTGSNNSGPGGYLVTNSSATAITVLNSNTVAASGVTATLNLVVTNFDGPLVPSTNSSGASTPFPNPPATGGIFVEGAPVGASLTPRSFQSGWNYTNSQMSTQKVLDTQNVMNGIQQGSPSISNAASVVIARQLPGFQSGGFVVWTGKPVTAGF
ncbi:MAG TPA: hypothetical protein VMQ17_08250 [Candidatus Sulfotelmatobacter sp.]|jgi:hypothetical protein|nr:hypothetical protein [Candidatus Sulfotelmatobacter sp.]